jgi:nitric oxide dioxygenase
MYIKGGGFILLAHHQKIVQETIPALREHGEAITRVFYRELFGAHPELLNFFNPVNQQNGGQARSLAASILTYAAHIDKLDQLSGMVDQIAQKHASLEIRPEHYPIVGKHLLGAISIVLGAAATPEIIGAWAAAYQQLANVMTARERDLYDQGAQQSGGWRGYKPLRVSDKVRESETIASFYLERGDGKPLPAFRPGQYVGVKALLPDAEYAQVRQYSLSNPPIGQVYRISVKREPAPARGQSLPGGQISNYLHDYVNIGDSLLVHVPQGQFVLNEAGNEPVVLLSGGVGVTPALCMLRHLAEQQSERPVLFIHATAKQSHHAFGSEVRELARRCPHVRAVIYYEEIGHNDIKGREYDEQGRITTGSLRRYLLQGDAEYYYCGPLGFMTAVNSILDELGVPLAKRYSETFAPSASFEAELAKS